GSGEIIKLNWDENFVQTAEFISRTITKAAFAEIKQAVERFITRNQKLFRRRQEGGFIRRCHGDLHSRNIFITDRVYIFDCIEFNPRFSCSDTAAEVAFMAMDLDYYRRHDLSNFFVERYLVYSDDEGFLLPLNFYKCYRAYVRGKVISFQLNDRGVLYEAKVRAKRVAQRYFGLALSYTRLLEAKPYLLVVFGLPGVGKSYLARRFAERRFAMHLSSDSVRKQICGLPVTARRSEDYGKGVYAPEVSKMTYDEMIKRAAVFLGAGMGVVLDATFKNEETRAQCRQLAQRLKIPVLFVLVECPEKTVIQRLRRRAVQVDFSDAGQAVYRVMKEEFQPPKQGQDLLRIDSRERIDKVLTRIEQRLKGFCV
ncbi:MAG: AAA family ATPase, partial [bacterium]